MQVKIRHVISAAERGFRDRSRVARLSHRLGMPPSGSFRRLRGRTRLWVEGADGAGSSTHIRRATPARGSHLHDPPLDASTWDAFAELVERNNGVYGGCWCIAHHSEYQRGVSTPHAQGGARQGGPAHAALVLDEDDAAQGWCQYGSPEELGLKHQP